MLLPVKPLTTARFSFLLIAAGAAYVGSDDDAAGTGADDGDLFVPFLDLGQGKGSEVHTVRRHALELANGHGLVDLGAPALGFAGGGADPAEDPGKGQPLHDQSERLGVLSLSDELDVTLNVDTGRACGHAGCPVLFLDVVGDGDRLGKSAPDGLARAQTHIPGVGDAETCIVLEEIKSAF